MFIWLYEKFRVIIKWAILLNDKRQLRETGKKKIIERKKEEGKEKNIEKKKELVVVWG